MNKKKIIFVCIAITLILLVPIKKIKYKGVDGVEYGVGYKAVFYEIIKYIPYSGATGGIEIQLLGNVVYSNVRPPSGFIFID